MANVQRRHPVCVPKCERHRATFSSWYIVLMSRERRRIKAKADLQRLEDGYIALLTDALRECKGGTWGLFGANDTVYERAGYRKSKSPARTAVLEAGEEINRERESLGLDPYVWHERFLAFSRRTHRDNALGEPKLAAELAMELTEAGVLETSV
jgi:hypothetical protein